MVEEVVEREIEAAAELALKVGAVAIPGAQLISGSKNLASAIISITSLLYASGDLLMELTDATCDKLRTSVSGRQFCAIWNNLGLSVSTASNVNDIVGQKVPLFYILCFTWDNLLDDPDLSLEEMLGESEYNRISSVINQIKQALNE